MKELILANDRGVAIVDDRDYLLASSYQWRLLRNRKNGMDYARSGSACLLLHRLLLNAPKGSVIDHVNRNGLDNRRRNLRLASYAQNSVNKLSRRGSSSKYMGVHWRSDRSRWYAEIRYEGKKIHIGSFVNEDDAAVARDKTAVKYYGSYAYLNFEGEA